MNSKEQKKKITEDQIAIADSLNKIQIEQLHKATLNFSSNSLETKKLCITAEVAAFTLLTGLYTDKTFTEIASVIRLFGILIPTLFYFVDVVLYFYQDKLREQMLIEADKMRIRHALEPKGIEDRKPRVFRSFFNGSQLMYLGLVLISFMTPWLVRTFGGALGA